MDHILVGDGEPVELCSDGKDSRKSFWSAEMRQASAYRVGRKEDEQHLRRSDGDSICLMRSVTVQRQRGRRKQSSCERNRTVRSGGGWEVSGTALKERATLAVTAQGRSSASGNCTRVSVSQACVYSTQMGGSRLNVGGGRASNYYLLPAAEQASIRAIPSSITTAASTPRPHSPTSHQCFPHPAKSIPG